MSEGREGITQGYETTLALKLFIALNLSANGKRNGRPRLQDHACLLGFRSSCVSGIPWDAL